MVTPASAALGTPPGGGAVAPPVINLGSTWAFSDVPTMADPGSATFRLDNATQTDATAIAISTIADSGVDLGAVIRALKARDRIYLQDRSDKAKFHLVEIAGAPTDNTTWLQLPIIVLDSGSDFDDADLIAHALSSPTQPIGDLLIQEPFQGGSVLPVTDGAANNLSQNGILADGGVTHAGSGSTALVKDADGVFCQITPGANNGEQGFWTIPNAITQARYEPTCLIKFRFVNDDRSRLWLGFGGNAAVDLNTDNPAQDHAMLRFEDGDTNFNFVSKAAGVQSVVDSAITPVNGTTYHLKIEVVSGQATFTLYDANFAVLASHVETTNPPDDTDDLRLHLYTQNDGVNGNRDIGIFFAHVQNRKP